MARTIISDLQALRNTLDSSIEQNTEARERAIKTSNDQMVAYWQGTIDAQNSFRNHLQAIITSELFKEHRHTQACYGVEHGDLVCDR